MFCKGASPARKRYERDLFRFMAVYALLLFGCSWILHQHGAEHLTLYALSVLPALPVLAVIFRMGRYLREETDEYQRMLAMQAILVGTAALLGTLVVNDFLRAFAGSPALPPFVSFVLFCAGMGLTQLVQKLRDRVPDGD